MSDSRDHVKEVLDATRTKMLVYDEYKEGYPFHTRLLQTYGQSVYQVLQRNIEIKTIVMMVSGTLTYAIRTTDAYAHVICDLIAIGNHAFHSVQLMMADQGKFPEIMWVDNSPAIIFLRREMAENSNAIMTGTLKPLSIIHQPNFCRVTKREYKPFAPGIISLDKEFNRHPETL